MLVTDLRQACRLIVRDRALTIAAVLTLMLAIGAKATKSTAHQDTLCLRVLRDLCAGA